MTPAPPPRLPDGLPTPTWKDDRYGVALYRADCLDVLAAMPDGCVGACVTDPPYGNNYSTGHRKGVVRHTTKVAGDIMVRPLLSDTAAALKPLLSDTAAVYWFAAPDRLDIVLPILRKWKVTNVLCWDKGNCTAGDLEASYGKQWEAIVFARTGREPLLGGRDRDVLHFSRGNVNAYQHPTQKPVALMEYLIGRHTPGVVLDPFAGSATTGVACVNLGRAFIGCELEPKYFDIAVARISQAIIDKQDGPLFATHEPAQMEIGGDTQ